jgi:hypothetical protein
VVRGALAVRVAHDDLALGAEDDLLDRVGEVGLLDLLVIAARREQRGLVDQQREVGARHARRRCGDALEVDGVGKRHRARVDLEDLQAPDLVRRLHGDAAIEAARAQQRRIEDLGPVGGAEDDDVRPRLEAVHLGEDLVERLLALVVAAAEAAAARALAADRVELVDEDDRRRGLLGLLEEVAHARGADADDRLDELRGRDREERGLGLAGDRARQQRLAGAGRAVEQHAARDPRAQALVALGVAQEIHDLDELVLGLVDAGDVVEGHARLLIGLHAPRLRAAEAAERAASGRAPREPDEQADEQDRRAKAEDQRPERGAAAVGCLRVDDDVLLGQQLRQVRRVDERGHLRLELVDLLGLATGRRVRRRLLEVALDRLLGRRDLLHVAGLDLLDEERLVWDARALGRLAGGQRKDEVERQQPDEDADEHAAALARDHRRALLRWGTAPVGRRLHPPRRRLVLMLRRGALGRVRRGGGRGVGHRVLYISLATSSMNRG